MRKKNRGSYYTSSDLAEYITRHSFQGMTKKIGLSILEPSCGDGVFIEKINEYLAANNITANSLDAVEVNKPAQKGARKRARTKIKKVDIYLGDFFKFIREKPRKKYDLILGNPPYVIKKRLSTATVKACHDVYVRAGLSEKTFHNIWAAFLISCIERLTAEGILAFVLPAELLQVKFTKQIRSFLQEKFDRIEVVTFEKIVFDEIGQDTIILFCYAHAKEKGTFFSHVNDVRKLNKTPPKFKRIEHLSEDEFKWTSHILSRKEIDLLSKLKKKFAPVSQYCHAAAGIVTAANDFFIVNEKRLDEYALRKFGLPIIQKGSFINVM